MLTIVCALLVVLQSTPATRTIADADADALADERPRSRHEAAGRRGAAFEGVVESGALFFELEITEFSVTR